VEFVTPLHVKNKAGVGTFGHEVLKGVTGIYGTERKWRMQGAERRVS
jgi:hypothetical protein